jgi:hypothetical protein
MMTTRQQAPEEEEEEKKEEAAPPPPLREELVGHGALIALALVGVALYSTTYSLLQASTQTRVAASLELWLVTTHLASGVACYAVQALLGPIACVAPTQSALFLGMACTMTVLAAECTGASAYYCAMYFGGAALPQLAAVGAAAWAWIMYASSLACQTMAAIDLGGGLVASAAMALVPWVCAQSLANACGDGWRVLLCGNVKVTLTQGGTGTSITTDCGNVDSGLAMAGLGVGMLLLAWVGALLGAFLRRDVRPVTRSLTACLLGLSPYLAQSVAGADARVSPTPASYPLVAMALAACTLLYYGRSATATLTLMMRRQRSS